MGSIKKFGVVVSDDTIRVLRVIYMRADKPKIIEDK